MPAFSKFTSGALMAVLLTAFASSVNVANAAAPTQPANCFEETNRESIIKFDPSNTAPVNYITDRCAYNSPFFVGLIDDITVPTELNQVTILIKKATIDAPTGSDYIVGFSPLIILGAGSSVTINGGTFTTSAPNYASIFLGLSMNHSTASVLLKDMHITTNDVTSTTIDGFDGMDVVEKAFVLTPSVATYYLDVNNTDVPFYTTYNGGSLTIESLIAETDWAVAPNPYSQIFAGIVFGAQCVGCSITVKTSVLPSYCNIIQMLQASAFGETAPVRYDNAQFTLTENTFNHFLGMLDSNRDVVPTTAAEAINDTVKNVLFVVNNSHYTLSKNTMGASMIGNVNFIHVGELVKYGGAVVELLEEVIFPFTFINTQFTITENFMAYGFLAANPFQDPDNGIKQNADFRDGTVLTFKKNQMANHFNVRIGEGAKIYYDTTNERIKPTDLAPFDAFSAGIYLEIASNFTNSDNVFLFDGGNKDALRDSESGRTYNSIIYIDRFSSNSNVVFKNIRTVDVKIDIVDLSLFKLNVENVMATSLFSIAGNATDVVEFQSHLTDATITFKNVLFEEMSAMYLHFIHSVFTIENIRFVDMDKFNPTAFVAQSSFNEYTKFSLLKNTFTAGIDFRTLLIAGNSTLFMRENRFPVYVRETISLRVRLIGGSNIDHDASNLYNGGKIAIVSEDSVSNKFTLNGQQMYFGEITISETNGVNAEFKLLSFFADNVFISLSGHSEPVIHVMDSTIKSNFDFIGVTGVPSSNVDIQVLRNIIEAMTFRNLDLENGQFIFSDHKFTSEQSRPSWGVTTSVFKNLCVTFERNIFPIGLDMENVDVTGPQSTLWFKDNQFGYFRSTENIAFLLRITTSGSATLYHDSSNKHFGGDIAITSNNATNSLFVIDNRVDFYGSISYIEKGVSYNTFIVLRDIRKNAVTIDLGTAISSTVLIDASRAECVMRGNVKLAMVNAVDSYIGVTKCRVEGASVAFEGNMTSNSFMWLKNSEITSGNVEVAVATKCPSAATTCRVDVEGNTIVALEETDAIRVSATVGDNTLLSVAQNRLMATVENTNGIVFTAPVSGSSLVVVSNNFAPESARLKKGLVTGTDDVFTGSLELYGNTFQSGSVDLTVAPLGTGKISIIHNAAEVFTRSDSAKASKQSLRVMTCNAFTDVNDDDICTTNTNVTVCGGERVQPAISPDFAVCVGRGHPGARPVPRYQGACLRSLSTSYTTTVRLSKTVNAPPTLSRFTPTIVLEDPSDPNSNLHEFMSAAAGSAASSAAVSALIAVFVFVLNF